MVEKKTPLVLKEIEELLSTPKYIPIALESNCNWWVMYNCSSTVVWSVYINLKKINYQSATGSCCRSKKKPNERYFIFRCLSINHFKISIEHNETRVMLTFYALHAHKFYNFGVCVNLQNVIMTAKKNAEKSNFLR